MSDYYEREVIDDYKEHIFHTVPVSSCSDCYSYQKLQGKCNGLHGGTKFYEYSNDGRVTIEYHEHPITGELVILRTWYVQDGADDVSGESEVMAVYPMTACELSKLNAPYMVNGEMPQKK